MERITKDQFDAYESVRQSGETNMFDVATVGMLSGLERPDILTIMENYSTLKEQHGENQ